METLAAHLPPTAKVVRGGVQITVEAEVLVPGGVLVVEEGDRVSTDTRLMSGAVESDLSTLNGSRCPRSAPPGPTGRRPAAGGP